MVENKLITRQQNRKDYERIMFCIKALGSETDPDFTHYLHVENGKSGSRIVATDGKRLHVSNLSIRIPAGNYLPQVRDYTIILGNSKEIVFPGWKNVVPEDAVYKGILQLEGMNSGNKVERDERFTNIYCTFLFDTGFNVNLGYIKDLPVTKWKIFTKKGKNKLVLLQNMQDEKNQYAVFVPVCA